MKIAVIFPGIGYHTDKPLLYYGKKLAVAAAYARRKHLKTCNIVYTPVEQTFRLMDQPGLFFHGTNDPWMPHDLFMKLCAETGYPYRLIEGGNHSLETGDVMTDLRNVQMIMEETDKYIKAQTISI